MELKDLRSYIKLKELNEKLAVQVSDVYNATKETINSISGCYNNYTMHDMGHGLRVASYMEEIAFGINGEFEENINKFNAFELALLILSAILHDIGMFIRPEDTHNIKNNNIKYTTELTYGGVFKVKGNQEETIKEIVRLTHHQRINEFINYNFDSRTLYSMLMLEDKYPYSDDIVSICVAHGENYDYLKKLRTNCTKGNYNYNLQFLAAILRIADYLDLDKQRTPILWFKMMNIEGFSKEEWEKHFIIHNETKLKKYIGNKNQIFFEGKSANAKIHRKYLRYVDELKMELENADSVLNINTTAEKYILRLSTKVDDCVQTEGFKYSDLRLNLDYSAITELLMGKNIYGDNRLGLRELIQNSIDACELMKEIYLKGEEAIISPQISVTYSEKQNFVKIKDTGIGMTLDIVKKHFLNVGKSYYKSNEYKYENYSYKPIGQYGIGFLACFLLSDNVLVKTKYYKNNEINQIELERSSEYVVTNTEETGNFFGTEIILDYDKFFKVFSGKNELIAFLERYFYTPIPIYVKDLDNDSEPTCIENFRQRVLNKNESSNKIESIVCEEYCDKITGILRTESCKPKKDFVITTIDKSYYVFRNNVFEKVSSPNDIIEGYYHYIPYAILNEEEYTNIKKTRKSYNSIRKAILSNCEKVYLLINIKDNLRRFYPFAKEHNVSINETNIKDVLINSGLPYYAEFFIDAGYIEKVFVSENLFINLQPCDIDDCYYYGDDFTNDNSKFDFYNKGVWIRDAWLRTCYFPFAIKVEGMVNYRNDGIKLDVSRNRIIKGSTNVSYDIANIILKHYFNKIDDGKTKDFITKMIEFNSKNIIDPDSIVD